MTVLLVALVFVLLVGFPLLARKAVAEWKWPRWPFLTAGFCALLATMSSFVFAYPGGIGIPPVIDWAGVAGANGISWGPVPAITATQAGITYDGTVLSFNAPSAKKIQFKINGSAAGEPQISGSGVVFQNASDSNVGVTFTGTGTKTLTLQGNPADGASAIGVVVNNATTLSTAGAEIAEFQNNGTKKSAVDLNGNYSLNNGGIGCLGSTTCFGEGAGGSAQANAPTGQSFFTSVNGATEWSLGATNVLKAVAAASALIEGANNQDLTLAQQGTAKNVIHFASGNGSANADRCTMDSDGVHLSVAAEKFDAGGSNFQVGAGGATAEAVTIAPGTSSGAVNVGVNSGTSSVSITAAGTGTTSISGGSGGSAGSTTIMGGQNFTNMIFNGNGTSQIAISSGTDFVIPASGGKGLRIGTGDTGTPLTLGRYQQCTCAGVTTALAANTCRTDTCTVSGCTVSSSSIMSELLVQIGPVGLIQVPSNAAGTAKIYSCNVTTGSITPNTGSAYTQTFNIVN